MYKCKKFVRTSVWYCTFLGARQTVLTACYVLLATTIMQNEVFKNSLPYKQDTSTRMQKNRLKGAVRVLDPQPRFRCQSDLLSRPVTRVLTSYRPHRISAFPKRFRPRKKPRYVTRPFVPTQQISQRRRLHGGKPSSLRALVKTSSRLGSVMVVLQR